ncbi:MAG: hypothetical protein V7784_07145 [Oceanospirillaceae bacterium]
MKKVFIFITALILALLLIAQIDDKQTAEVKTLLDRIGPTDSSPSYIYLLGLSANENDNPEKVGSALLEEYRKEEVDESYIFKDYRLKRKISLPEGDLFCTWWAKGCLDKLFNTEIGSFNQEHAVLLSRLDEFYTFKEYKTLTIPIITERFPPFQYISKAVRVKVLHAIKAYKAGFSEEAILDLEYQLLQLRHALALQDTLVGKMVFLSKLSEVVDVLGIIAYESKIALKKTEPLSIKEKSLEAASAREFALSYHSLKNLRDLSSFTTVVDHIPTWLSRILYKPNMSINAMEPFHTRWGRLSLLSPTDFAKEIELEPTLELSTSSIRNYVGNILNSIALPNYDLYVSRFMDFDAKLALLNSLSEGVDSALNPYYKNEGPEISINKVCFRGPLEDVKFQRCLRLKKI